MCVLSGLWSPQIGQHQGKGSLANVAGPDVGRGRCLSGFAAFLGLELKYNCGLDVADVGQNLTVLGTSCLGAVLQPPCSFPLYGDLTPMTSNMPERGRPGEERLLWGQGPCFPSFARC